MLPCFDCAIVDIAADIAADIAVDIAVGIAVGIVDIAVGILELDPHRLNHLLL